MNKINPPKLIVIVGPTASGKSDLALRLAKLAQGKPFKKIGILGAEIISADSRQVYTGMNLGTGKVPKDSSRNFQFPISNFQSISKSKISKKDYYSSGIRHHLIDVANPKKQFTASDFKKLGEKALKEIVAKQKLPIIVGGTGFYIDILLGRMATAEVPPNLKLRSKLKKQSADKLFKMLLTIDPERAKTIDRYNKRRLIRALEIVLTTGKPVPKPVASIKYQVLWIGLKPEDLGIKIKKRLDARLKEGMIDEVNNLKKSGISWERLDDFGLEYRQIARWLKNGKFPMTNDKSNLNSKAQIKEFRKSEYYEKLLTEIIKYSKRQMTWFKRNKEINWFTLSGVEGTKDTKTAERLAQRFMS